MLSAVGLVLIDIAVTAARIRMLVVTPICVGRAVFALIQEPRGGRPIKPCGSEFWRLLGRRWRGLWNIGHL
jgi:hypothetical protein